ncbi:hypothetical protein AOLI_G00194420 [Acnodon oligacanthus]
MHPTPGPSNHPTAASGAAPGVRPPNRPMLSLASEQVYRGPQPTIPKLIHPDPSEFVRLRIALGNLLPPDATELFKYQILVDHLKLDEVRLIADAYLNSPAPYTDNMIVLHDKFDQPHLITPVESVRLGLPGGPAAVHTRLGWTLQGPIRYMGHPIHPTQCLDVSSPSHTDDLYRHVERLWQVDTIPLRHDREVTRSKQDQQAVTMLKAKTVHIEVDGLLRYPTPLLRHVNIPLLHTPRESVMPMLRSSERHLLKNPSWAETYKNEMQKLIEAGAVWEVTQDVTLKVEWYIPHHLISHNGKDRLVFNCSHQYLGQTLNQYLLPGPTLGASLLGVLVRFRKYHVAVSGDIKGMFHQIHLLPEDRPLLSQPDDTLRFTVENCFYVDNYLQRVRTPSEAKIMVDRLRDLMASAGFELRYLLPFSTQVKLIIRKLWDKQRSWDDRSLPAELLKAWSTWEDELRFVPFITFPRAYVPVGTDLEGATHEVHIFENASEQAYGAVAYMRAEDCEGQDILHPCSLMPKRLHSIPCLELCAALVAAQLAHVLERERSP